MPAEMNDSVLVVSVKLVSADDLIRAVVETYLNLVRDRAFDLGDYTAGRRNAAIGGGAIRPVRS